jgi:hypothetical protein
VPFLAVMVSRDYTKEVGLPTAQKTVSKPVAAVILLAIAVGIWFAAKTLMATPPHSEMRSAEATTHR